jgi:hypothetical protein
MTLQDKALLCQGQKNGLKGNNRPEIQSSTIIYIFFLLIKEQFAVGFQPYVSVAPRVT